MAPSSTPYRTPSRAQGQNRDDGSELTHSLKNLSLATKAPRSPSVAATTRSPSSMSVRSSLPPRSPLANGRSDPRSATPTLLRKASLNSIRSASVNGVAPPRRASSVNVMSPSMLRSPLGGSQSPPEEVKPPPKPVLTAASVACDYFKTELESRHGEKPDPTTETVVIMNDSCYGHRFSRPRTSRAALNTIVERPERIKASALGVAAAYVRLGERHADGVNPIHPSLDPSSLPSIPFRIQKTSRRLSLLSPTVTNVHGAKWMEELKTMCDSAEAKLAMNGKELQRPESSNRSGGGGGGGNTDQEPPRKLHEGDLYLCAESLDALEGALGGVCEAVDAIFQPANPARRAFVAIRPPGHHCSASFPSGFCWINNVHVGIMHAILSHGLTHAAIVDFDLHHGDGSQSIAWQHNSRGVGLAKNAAWWKKTSIGYFSVHDINSYPCEMGDEDKVRNASICIENAHGQNVWNVHLQPWKTEAEFWKLYESKYSVLLEKTRAFLRAQAERFRTLTHEPKGAIFLSAGFDASEWEGAGMQRHNVNVPTEFYARLTRDVVRIASEVGTSVEGRVISVLEGGYSDRALWSGILSHLSGLAGDDALTTKENQFNGLGYEMGRRMTSTSSTGSLQRQHSRSVSTSSLSGLIVPPHPYDAHWWSLAELEHMEATMAPPAPPAEPRKPRNMTPPTYSTPTQSSQAKVVTTASPKLRRSLSNMSLANGSPISRAPTPPPPDVPWTVAAHELSKLLIPTDRQTTSCRPQDLSAEATRQRRDRQSIALTSPTDPPPVVTVQQAPTRMSLRERKTTKSYLEEDDEDDFDMAKNRRKTVAGASVLASDKAATRGVAPQGAAPKPRQSGRRLSAASTIIVPELAVDRSSIQLQAAAPPPTNGIARPGTSQSVRPESSMSVRLPTNAKTGGTLPVKKTRAPAAKADGSTKTARGAPKKTAAPSAAAGAKTAASAKRGSAVASASSSVSGSTAGLPLSNPPSNATTTATPPAEGDDMDKLTSGMKKIKITLLTKAAKEARAKAEQDKGRSDEGAPQRPPPLKKTGSSSNGVKNEASSPLDTIVVTTPSVEAIPVSLSSGPASSGAPSSPVMKQETPAADEITTPLPSPSPFEASGSFSLFVSLPPSSSSRTPTATTPTTTTSPPAAALATADVFIPFQPEGPTPEPVALLSSPAQNQPLRWLPPNTGTPSPMKRRDLPVFTATSTIPFASSPPPPPRQLAAGGGGAAAAAEKSSPILVPPQQLREEGQQKKAEGAAGGDLVWDVPETPQK